MSLYQRKESKVWYFEFWHDGTRHRGSTGETSKTKAILVEAQKREEVSEAARLNALGIKRITLFKLASDWLAESRVALRDHRNNEHRVRKLFGDGLEKRGDEWTLKEGCRHGLGKTLMVHEIVQEHLMTLRSQRLLEGNSPATINREMSLIQSLLGYAQARGVMLPPKPLVWSQGRNKVASVKLPESKGKLRWLSHDEENRLLADLYSRIKENDVAGQDNFDLVTMLLDSGARYSEITMLRWDCVDLELGAIDLYRGKVTNEGRLRVTQRVLAILKRRKEVTWPNPHVFPALRQCGRGRYEYAPGDGHRGHATEGIQDSIDRVGLNDDASKDRVTPHTFRDTFASRLVQAGVSLLKVSHLLGHSNVQMTQKYAHLCPDNTGIEAVAILNGMHAANKVSEGDDPIPETGEAGQVEV